LKETHVTAVEDAPKTKTKTQPENLLIVSMGDKGGSSKSFLIRLIAERHMAIGTPNLHLADGDGSVNSLWWFHQQADLFSFHGDLNERDRLVNSILRPDRPLVVADMPAMAITKLREIADEYDFVEMVRARGYRMTLVMPITPYREPTVDLQEIIHLFEPEAFKAFEAVYDSIPELVEASKVVANRDSTADQIRDARAVVSAKAHEIDAKFDAAMPKKTRADYVAVVNLGMMAENRRDFKNWDAPEAFTRRLLRFVGGIELEIPKLRATIASTLHDARKTFKAGETYEYFEMTDRGRLQKWNEAVEATLRSAGKRLGF
jgi:hypothetical protein